MLGGGTCGEAGARNFTENCESLRNPQRCWVVFTYYYYLINTEDHGDGPPTPEGRNMFT